MRLRPASCSTPDLRGLSVSGGGTVRVPPAHCGVDHGIAPCELNWCLPRSTWRRVNANPERSSNIQLRGASIRLWPSPGAVRKPEYGLRWVVSGAASSMSWRRGFFATAECGLLERSAFRTRAKAERTILELI